MSSTLCESSPGNHLAATLVPLPWQTPPAEEIKGQHRHLHEIMNCCKEFGWKKFEGFAALSCPKATLKHIHWTHVITQIWLMSRAEATGSGVHPTDWPKDISLDTWQNTLLRLNLATVDGLQQYIRAWGQEDPRVQSWITGNKICHKATADLGGWLADYVNTAFMRMTSQATPQCQYLVVENRLYHSLGKLIGPTHLGPEKTGNAWEQLCWHAYEQGKAAFVLAVIWNTSNRALEAGSANADTPPQSAPKHPPPTRPPPPVPPGLPPPGLTEPPSAPAKKAPPPTRPKISLPRRWPKARGLPDLPSILELPAQESPAPKQSCANMELHRAPSAPHSLASCSDVQLAVIFSIADAEMLRNQNHAPQGLRKALRAHLQQVAEASEITPQDRSVEVPSTLPWRDYIAHHQAHDEWIGTGIIRFHLFFGPQRDANRGGQLRLNYVIQRLDNSHVLLHPGSRAQGDANPRILPPGEFHSKHQG
jgi:hypothetical protein